jgi:hypothetical protein
MFQLHLIQEDQFTYKELHPGTISLTNHFRRGDFNGKEFVVACNTGEFLERSSGIIA